MSGLRKTTDSKNLTLFDVLRHDARHFPDRVAIRIDGKELTFGDLHRRVVTASDVLGRYLRPGDCAGIWLHNSFEWVVSFLALNALGAVSVPISTRLTASECAAIVADADARALVTTRHYRLRDYLSEAMAIEPPGGREFIVVETIEDQDEAEWPVHARGGGAAPRSNELEDVLCIQYTSGTTAKPKGVVLTNQAYLQTATYVARCQRLTPSARFISGAPFFHCSGTMHAITVCLLAGCELTAMSSWDPEQFLEATAANGCDVSHMIYFRDVLALGSINAREKLKTLKIGHDLGTPDFLMQVHDELGIDGISNLYGMTETAGQFTMWFPDDPLEKRVGQNGRPQAGNELRILSCESGMPVGPGETGEIQMRGPTLSRGYFRRPDATSEGFTEDGWLRSGDLGMLSEAGELRYLARLKEIIRVGGENLAPAEVEQAIRDITGIQQLCVLGIPDARLDEIPAAVLVCGHELDWTPVSGALRARLAGFKIPRQVYVADELPMTPTNRVQRAQLRERIQAGALTRIA